MWLLKNHSNKINVYCVTLMQVFSHWTLCFKSFFNAVMQHCNMFQTHIFKENFNKISMQCSHSKHVKIVQTWGYNCNKQNFYVLMEVSHLSIFLKMSKKWKTWTPCHCLCQKKESKIFMLLSNLKEHLLKPIFISHHAFVHQ
jgi:hypothetical protein